VFQSISSRLKRYSILALPIITTIRATKYFSNFIKIGTLNSKINHKILNLYDTFFYRYGISTISLEIITIHFIRNYNFIKLYLVKISSDNEKYVNTNNNIVFLF